MWEEKKNLIVDKTIAFALSIIKFAEVLEQNKKYVISKQLLRSGTAIGANVIEAQDAESRKDFIHKMKIAAKEARETSYWLILCEKSESYPSNNEMMNQLELINKILSKIIATSKRNFTTILISILTFFKLSH
jgi:four helix bundle protein